MLKASRLVVAAITMAACACASAKPTPAVQEALRSTERLGAADRALWAGCFDCLVEALHQYEAVRASPAASPAVVADATSGWIRASLLLGFRQRELGMSDEGYLQRAREAIEPHDELRAAFGRVLDAIDVSPSPIARPDILPDRAASQRMATLREELPAFLAELGSQADADPLSAYAWIALSCSFGNFRDRNATALLAPFREMRDMPLVAYRVGVCVADRSTLADVLAREPRSVEINYWLGLQEVANRRPDLAEPLLVKAYDWHHDWPAITNTLGGLYFAFEEPDRALDFYNQTLTLIPGYPDALIGRVKSLSMLGRYDEAFRAIDFMLDGEVRIIPGEAYYWRAWDHAQLDHVEEAWVAIEEANKFWRNSEVSKLGGLMAYKRRDFATAQKRFETARTLYPGDCEPHYFLGLIAGSSANGRRASAASTPRCRVSSTIRNHCKAKSTRFRPRPSMRAPPGKTCDADRTSSRWRACWRRRTSI